MSQGMACLVYFGHGLCVIGGRVVGQVGVSAHHWSVLQTGTGREDLRGAGKLGVRVRHTDGGHGARWRWDVLDGERGQAAGQVIHHERFHHWRAGLPRGIADRRCQAVH